MKPQVAHYQALAAEAAQQHTPGKWEVFSTETGAGRVLKHQVRANADCAFGEDSFTVTLRNEADARLIAAAPETAAERDRLKAVNAELLAALEETQADVSDARALASKILDNPRHGVTGTEAERIAFLLQTMERNSRIARAAIAKVQS